MASIARSSHSPVASEVNSEDAIAGGYDELGVEAKCAQVRREGAEKHVALALKLADLGLTDTERRREVDLSNADASPYCSEVDHANDTTLKP